MAIEGVGSQLPALQSFPNTDKGVERADENEKRLEKKDKTENNSESEKPPEPVKESDRGASLDVVG